MIKVGDIVEEIGTDSGRWIVTEVYRNTPRHNMAAKLTLIGKPSCTAHCALERLVQISL